RPTRRTEPMSAYETEALPELEGLHEMSHEGEAFLGGLGNIALNAAQSVLGALGEAEIEGETEYESEFAAEINPVRKVYPDAMLEHLAHEALQAESESEAAEAFLPLIPLAAAKLLPLAMKAAPMIAKAMPKVMNVVSRVTPHLTRGVANMART